LVYRNLNNLAQNLISQEVKDFLIDKNFEKGQGGGMEWVDGKPEGSICRTCTEGRQHKELMTGERIKGKSVLAAVYSDICGSIQTCTIDSEWYFLTFIDERTERIAVYLLQRKSEIFERFQQYKSHAEKEIRRVIKSLRRDGGGKYMSREMKKIS
jgi:hypothetical protein